MDGKQHSISYRGGWNVVSPWETKIGLAVPSHEGDDWTVCGRLCDRCHAPQARTISRSLPIEIPRGIRFRTPCMWDDRYLFRR